MGRTTRPARGVENNALYSKLQRQHDVPAPPFGVSVNDDHDGPDVSSCSLKE